MSSNVQDLLGNQVEVQLSGRCEFQGILMDYGQDLLVLFNGQQYIYIPLLHVHRIKINTNEENFVDKPSESYFTEGKKILSYRKMLINAKGVFSEIYVTGNLSFHGYVTNVLSNYLAFYSPVYKLLLIPLEHLKWLMPYNENTTPYSLSSDNLPVHPSTLPLQRYFDEQLKKTEGKLVVFDAGTDPNKIGLLKKVENNFADLVNANGETIHLQVNHIKSVQIP